VDALFQVSRRKGTSSVQKVAKLIWELFQAEPVFLYRVERRILRNMLASHSVKARKAEPE